MPAIVHVAGNFGPYTNNAGIAVSFLTSTSSSTRQAANSRVAITGRTDTSEPLSPVWSSALSEFWFHCVIYSDGQAAGSTGNPFITFYDSTSGDPQLRLIHTATLDEIQVQYYDGAWNDIGSTFTLTSDTRFRMDIHVVFHATTGSVNVYLDESLEMVYTGAVNSTELQADRILLQSSANSSAADKFYSELAVADYDTRGWNIVEIYPTANGAVTDWTGDYTSVDETITNNIDLMSTDTADDIATFSGGSVPVGPASQDMLAVVISVTAQVSPDGAINDIQPVLRLSSTNYAGTALPFDESVRTEQAVYTTNPATSAAWDVAEVDAMEFGVKAI